MSKRQSFLLLTLGRYKNISYVCSVIVMLMKTTTVALGSHFDEFIQASVLGGRYTNASEVIRAGLRKLEEDERKIAALRSAIEEGEASGYVDDFDFETHLQELNSKGRNNG
jgi:antitoxin ParD1/3/4